MPESVYKVIELVGTSTESWERAAAAGVELASKSLRDLRVAEVTHLDVHILDGGQLVYRTKLKVSFKYESADDLPIPKAAKKPRAAKKAPPPPPPPEEEPAPAKKAPRKGKKKA